MESRQGGVTATDEASWQRYFDKHMAEQIAQEDQLIPHRREIDQQSWDDQLVIVAALGKAPMRRAILYWSAPSER